MLIQNMKLYFHSLFLHLAFLYLSNCLSFIYTAEVLRPRGVSLSKKMFYTPNKDFVCIDGSKQIPFTFVNDDYCDCEDGSDEPGTSACSNALFHCVNSGHISINIPSSRVNDDICDCCDGGDEYNSSAECINTCLELGQQARQEAEKKQELYERGHAMWRQYAAEGKRIKEDNKAKLANLKLVEEEEEKVKAEKEAIKNEAEDKEKAALSVYNSLKEDEKKKLEEIQMLLHQEEEKKRAEEAFKDLDMNHDNILTFREIQEFVKFDSNHDGVVSEEEAKFFLHMKDSMVLEEFVTTGWMIMKPIYMVDKVHLTDAVMTESTEKSLPEASEIATPQTETDDETYNPEDASPVDDDDDDVDDDLIDDDELDQPPVFPPKEEIIAPKSDEPEYDEETQKLVDAANEARKQYNEAAEKLSKTKEEIKNLNEDIEADFGFEEEFSVLKGQCFDFDNREYTYRFCPFDKASQIPKSGGSDVNLGFWGTWAGPEENKYSKMKFDNGQTCWNGPARSVMVLLQCGMENKLLSTSEPNRCEYLFEFSTPALCSAVQNINSIHQHTEL